QMKNALTFMMICMAFVAFAQMPVVNSVYAPLENGAGYFALQKQSTPTISPRTYGEVIYESNGTEWVTTDDVTIIAEPEGTVHVSAELSRIDAEITKLQKERRWFQF